MPLFRAVAQDLLDDPEARAIFEAAGSDRLLTVEEQEVLVRKADMARRIGHPEPARWRHDGQSYTPIALARGMLSGRFAELDAPEVRRILEDAVEPAMVQGEVRKAFDLVRRCYLDHAVDILAQFASQPGFEDALRAQARDIAWGHAGVGEDVSVVLIEIARDYGIGPISDTVARMTPWLAERGIDFADKAAVAAELSDGFPVRSKVFREFAEH